MSDERRLLELLPWFVNGTLNDAERDEVREGLRSNLALRREHDRLVGLQDLMRQDDAERAATDRAFSRLMTRIERRRLWQRAAVWQAAAVLLVTVGLAFWWNRDAAEPFRTLSAPESVLQLRVVFAPGVAEEARRRLLDGHGLVVAAGPTTEGVYTLEMPAGADAPAIAEALREDPRILFASTPPAPERR